MKELATALAKAQCAFKHIARDKEVTVRTRTGGAYTFRYAPLETIMAAIKQALADNGIALLQDVREGKVVTLLMHASGDTYTSSGTPIKVAEDSAQAYGSGLTYARRYDLSLTLGLCPDDDDDGNMADGNTVTSATPKLAHKPTDGAWENVPKERHEALHRIASGVIDYFSANDPEQAFAYLDEQKLENEEKVAIWTLLDSKQRSVLKKLAAAKKEPANA